MAYVSIFMDNDLTHITEDHFEIKFMEYGHILYQLDISLHRFNYQDQFRKMMFYI